MLVMTQPKFRTEFRAAVSALECDGGERLKARVKTLVRHEPVEERE